MINEASREVELLGFDGEGGWQWGRLVLHSMLGLSSWGRMRERWLGLWMEFDKLRRERRRRL